MLKTLFPIDRNSVSTSQKKDLLKYISTMQKSCFRFKNFLKNFLKNLCLLAGIWFVFKSPQSKIDFPLISIIVSTSRKKLGIKQYCFQYKRSSFSLARVKTLLKNMFQLRKNCLPLAAVDCCLKKWKKMVSNCQKTRFHYPE